jgi:hypothetical protein
MEAAPFSLTPRDTTPVMAKKHFEMLLALSVDQRVRMAASMFDSARRIILSDLASRGVPREKWPGEIFRRTYACDFSHEVTEKIALRMDQAREERPDLSLV